jgi:hypothetical protein
MSVTEQEKKGSGATNAALKAAAAAAATGAATYAVKKVRSHGDNDDSESSENGSGRSKSKSSGSQGGILASAAATSWDAASEALVPMAEDVAEAAGKYLATHGPELLRDRIVPKFIEAFNDAK